LSNIIIDTKWERFLHSKDDFSGGCGDMAGTNITDDSQAGIMT
jgi:hypothetical protein